MGFDAEWSLADCMRRGTSGSGFPPGYLSEKRPCPRCQKPVAGRSVGMAEHMRAKHGLSRSEADAEIRAAEVFWSVDGEPRAALALAKGEA